MIASSFCPATVFLDEIFINSDTEHACLSVFVFTKEVLVKVFSLFFVGLFILAACSAEPVEVTRVVTETEHVEVTRLVDNPTEVTRIVEVTREVEVEVPVEVTRLVEVVVAPSATPTLASPEDVSPDMAFSANYLGELEQDGIKVELGRVLFMQRDAFKPDLDFDDTDRVDGHEYLGEVIWRITNNTDKSIQWSHDDIDVRISGRQIDLYDWLFYSFGETPTDPIFPGSTIIGGVWFGMGNTMPEEITEVSLLMGAPNDSDTYRDVSGNFVITADLSGPHEWVDIPDELRP